MTRKESSSGKILLGYDRSLRFARKAERLDERGNVTEVAYFDEAGRPVADSDGHARWTKAYDDGGRQIGEAYFGPDGKPARYQGNMSGGRPSTISVETRSNGHTSVPKGSPA